MVIKKTQQERKEHGLCVNCGRPNRGSKTLICSHCREKKNYWRNTQAKIWKKENKCIMCGRPPITKGVNYCKKHFLRKKSLSSLGTTTLWFNLDELYELQGRRCYYTGQDLEYGVNASPDHLIPITRNPALRGDINNVRWVLTKINFMKKNLTEDEFLEFVKKVFEWRNLKL